MPEVGSKPVVEQDDVESTTVDEAGVATMEEPATEEVKPRRGRKPAASAGVNGGEKATSKSGKGKLVKETPYPELDWMQYVGDNAMTAKQAMEFIGWTECDTNEKGCSLEVHKLTDKWVKLKNNTRNRYITSSWLLTLKQEHLNRKWRLNGETIVLGKSGQVLSGQHRLLSLILAWLEWNEGDQSAHWRKLWKGDVGPTMETLVVVGIEEDDDVFRTLNRGKPGTLAETFYRSAFFKHFDATGRKDICRIADRAIQLLWERTGLEEDPYAPKRTHGEAHDFLGRHKTLVDIVGQIAVFNKAPIGEDGKTLDEPITKYLSAGDAAGLCYLMATGKSDSDEYNKAKPPTEKRLSFDQQDKALDFWHKFSTGDNTLKVLFDLLNALKDAETGRGGTRQEKLALVCHAWDLFVHDFPLKSKDVKLEYRQDANGKSHLLSYPNLGGIDRWSAPVPRQKPVSEGSGEDSEE